MMKPWISTSVPLKVLMDELSAALARIDSASWAKVRRGICWAPAHGAASRPTSRAAITAIARPPGARGLCERGKILGDLRAIGHRRGKKSRHRAHDHRRSEHDRLQEAHGKRIRDDAAARRQQ